MNLQHNRLNQMYNDRGQGHKFNHQKFSFDQLQVMAERNRKSNQDKIYKERMHKARMMRAQTQFINYDKNTAGGGSHGNNSE